MSAKHYANLILLFHFFYILAVIVPALIIPIGAHQNWHWVRSRKIRSVHVAMMGLVLIEVLFGVTCPLTWLENLFLEAAGSTGYQESFIIHWVSRLMYWEAPAWIFTLAYGVCFAWIVLLWRLYPPSSAIRKSPSAS